MARNRICSSSGTSVSLELEDPGVEGEPTQLPVEDVGVVVIPAPDLGHHISAKDGRRVGHAEILDQQRCPDRAASIAEASGYNRSGDAGERSLGNLGLDPQPERLTKTLGETSTEHDEFDIEDGDDGRDGRPAPTRLGRRGDERAGRSSRSPWPRLST